MTTERQLIRPRFFAGQLLTNDDLTALQDWAATRFALLRQRHGWGVVCGLELSGDLGRPGRLYVSAGYAVDAQGRDIVLTEEVPADLPAGSGRDGGSCPNMNPTTGAQAGTFAAGPFVEDLAGLAVFDLMIGFVSEDADPVAAFSTTGARRCEPTRGIETGEVTFLRRDWKQVAGVGEKAPDQPISSLAKDVAELLGDFNKKFANVFTAPLGVVVSQAADAREWLSRRVGANPTLSRTFPTLRQWLAKPGAGLDTPWGVARVLFWLADALRRGRHPCPPCEGAPEGVPLARVWARLVSGSFEIVLVDDVPPYRKVMGGEDESAWAVETYVGRPWLDVQRALARLGRSSGKETFEMPADGAHLLKLLTAEPLLTLDASVVALVSQRTRPPGTDAVPLPEPLEGRVVAFRPGDASHAPFTKPETSLKVKLFPVPDPPVVGVKWADASAEPELLATAVPYGVVTVTNAERKKTSTPSGWVRVQIKPENPGDFGTATAFSLFDGITGQRVAVDGAWAAGKVVDATFALPKPDEPTPITSPEFTLFIGDADRLVAIQGRLDKSVVSYPWEGHLPVLEVVPVKLKADPQRELALFKNLPPLFEVHLSNPSPSAITGDLVYDTAVAPAALTPKRFGEVSREQIQTPGPATIKGQAGPVIRLTDAVAPGVRFWLAPARDAFQRAFIILPSPNSTFAFEQTNLEILINPAFVSSGSSASQSLTLKNTEEADITLKQLAASPWRGTAISEPSLTGKDALKKNVSQSFDLTGTADEWVVEMTLVRNSKTLLGVAVVKAAM